jgi:hypothetical protein
MIAEVQTQQSKSLAAISLNTRFANEFCKISEGYCFANFKISSICFLYFFLTY